MTSKVTSPEQYIKELPADRKEAFVQLRNTILKNLPGGFKEGMASGMIGYFIPHDKYPPGYHCDPRLPLPFASIASQKNFIAFYHMGVYAIPELYKWFVKEYSKHSSAKLDMGKSCVMFKKTEHIPYKLIGELMKKVSMQNWIDVYEQNIKT